MFQGPPRGPVVKNLRCQCGRWGAGLIFRRGTRSHMERSMAKRLKKKKKDAPTGRLQYSLSSAEDRGQGGQGLCEKLSHSLWFPEVCCWLRRDNCGES